VQKVIVVAISRHGNIASTNEIEIERDSESDGLVYHYLSFNSPRAPNVDSYPRYNDFGVSSYRPTKRSRSRYYVPQDDISGKPLKPSRDIFQAVFINGGKRMVRFILPGNVSRLIIRYCIFITRRCHFAR